MIPSKGIRLKGYTYTVWDSSIERRTSFHTLLRGIKERSDRI
jgi:hypothetical protein